jgi:hypothetical protein
MNKLMQLLEIAKKFGVKPSKVIGTQGNVVPMKKPTLVEVRVDEFKLKDSVDKGNISMDKVQQEMEETVKLALSKNLNDVELNRALNNAINLDRQFFPQSAEVVGITTKEPVAKEGIEQLLKDAGQTSPPGTLVGNIESRINKLKSLSKEGMTMDDILKDFASGQKGMARLEEEGLVRSTARQILINDIKAGKIKNISVEEAINMKEPIDPFRQIYGEDALEKLDSLIPNFKGLKTEIEAEQLARSKFKFEPDETRLPGSTSIDEAKKAEQEFGINKPEQTETTDVGEVVPFRKKNLEPEEKAKGGRVGRKKMFLGGFLSRLINSNPEIVSALKSQQTQSDVPLTLQERYRKYLSESETTPTNKDSVIGGLLGRLLKGSGVAVPQGGSTSANDFLYNLYKKNLEGKAEGGRIGYSKGDKVTSSMDKLLKQLNKKSSKKKSINQKIGKVNVSKKAIDKAEEPTGVMVMDQEPVTIVDEVALEK